MKTLMRCTVPAPMIALAAALLMKPVTTAALLVLDTAMVLIGMGTISFVARHIPRRGQPLGQPTPRERIARGLHVRAVTAAGVGAALAWVGQLDIGSMLLKGATVLAMAAAAVAIDEHLRPMGTERGRAGS